MPIQRRLPPPTPGPSAGLSSLALHYQDTGRPRTVVYRLANAGDLARFGVFKTGERWMVDLSVWRQHFPEVASPSGPRLRGN
jgi:hypothetical protein